MSTKVYLIAILENYIFRPLLNIFRLSSREFNLKYKQQTIPIPNNPPGEERMCNQGPPDTTNQSTAQKTQRVLKTKTINVEISTSDARNARISSKINRTHLHLVRQPVDGL